MTAADPRDARPNPPLAVVTGGAGAIGRALAERFRQRGYDLLLVDLDPAALRATAEALGARTFVADVSSPEAMRSLAEHVAGDVGAPDVLCLNAGIVGRHLGPVWETPLDQWERVLAVNLGGVANGLRAFVPPMLAAGGTRRIVITSSLAGLLTWPGGGSYGVSKHAVTALAEQTARSLEGTGIEVTVLFPALVRSGMSPDGIPADDLAASAFEVLDERGYAFVPPEWRSATVERARHLADGSRPPAPRPD